MSINLESFIKQVEDLRISQKQYFKLRSQNNLKIAKSQEKIVDDTINEYKSNKQVQGTLL